MSPPKDIPAALIDTAVALRFLNHLLNNAPVVVMETPLNAHELTTPNTKIRNRMWKVKASDRVVIPNTRRQVKITLRPPSLSKKLPMNGCTTPFRRNPSDAAKEIVPRFQPNSSLIGTTKIPNPCLLPAPINPIITVSYTHLTLPTILLV